jgi:molybdate transport system substrate-binding protein
MSLQNLLSRPADYSVSSRPTGMRWVRLCLVVAGTVVAFAYSMSVPKAAQDSALMVLSSNGVKAALEKLQDQSERAAGRPLNITFGTSASTRQRVLAGELFDVAILTAEVLDELTKAGRIVRGSTAKMGTSGIGIGIRAGLAKPDITTADALKHVLLAERSVTFAADGASRPFIERMFGALGVAEAMKPKTLLEQGSVRAAARVVQGDADMLFTLISEIVPVPGLQLVGPLPSEFQNYVSFGAGVGASAGQAEAAAKLIAYLSSQSASPAFTASGIER